MEGASSTRGFFASLYSSPDHVGRAGHKSLGLTEKNAGLTETSSPNLFSVPL